MKKEMFQKVISLTIIFVVIIANFAYAVTQSEIDNKKNEQGEIGDKIDEAQKNLEGVKEEKSETLAQVEKLTNQINQYEDEIDDLNSQIENLENSIEEAKNKINEATNEYDKQQDLLDKRLVALYEAGETSYLDVILSSSSITEFISNYFLVEELTSYDTELLQKIDKQKKEIEAAKAQLEEDKNKIEVAKKNEEVKRNQLSAAKKEKSAQVIKLSEEEQEIQKELEELQAANRKIANEIKIAEQKYKEQLEELKRQQQNNNSSSSGASSGGSGYFTRPVKTGSITANAYYSSGKFHGAIDYGVSVGTPVYAAADGVVMSTANLSSSYGTYVVIRHANGLQSYYAHGTSGSITVKPGDTVKQGQQIMKSGNTGNSKGPHLHFEVRKSPYSYSYSATAYGQDSRVNPANYL